MCIFLSQEDKIENKKCGDKAMTFYIDTRYANCSLEICRLLKACILEQTREWSEIIFLCIGTDRVTGDCLGPYIGAQLSNHAFPMVHVYGTLSAPVHALNLTDTMQEIQKRHPGSLIIAIDSSLGKNHRAARKDGRGNKRNENCRREVFERQVSRSNAGKEFRIEESK